MAGSPVAAKWNLSNWTQGPVTLFEALGVTKGTIKYPKLTDQLASAAIQSGANSSSGTTSKSSSSSNPTGSATGPLGPVYAANGCTLATDQSNQKLAAQMAAASPYGWTGAQWTALNNIVNAESGWCNTAQNSGSTAYGIGQFLNTTWAGTGYTKTNNAQTQIAAMLVYIKATYGSPEAAWTFHQNNGYY